MTASDSTSTAKKTAGALDIRVIIAALMGLYGVILTLAGVFGDPEDAKTGGVNANLWTGLGLLGVAVVFMVWARVRPIVVPDESGAVDSSR